MSVVLVLLGLLGLLVSGGLTIKALIKKQPKKTIWLCRVSKCRSIYWWGCHDRFFPDTFT